MATLLLAVKPSILWAGTSKLNVVIDNAKQPAIGMTQITTDRL